NFKRSKDNNFLHRCKLFKTNAKEDVLSGKRVDYYETIVGTVSDFLKRPVE
ncbi:hypothetical protein AC249_AIPGENE16115, partial [Exaiptasia diaphana]